MTGADQLPGFVPGLNAYQSKFSTTLYHFSHEEKGPIELVLIIL